MPKPTIEHLEDELGRANRFATSYKDERDALKARVAELERSLKIQCDHAAELEKETAAWSRESIRLSPEDQAVFAEALLNPPPMAEPLKRAFERLASLTK